MSTADAPFTEIAPTKVEHQQFWTKSAIADQFDIALNLLHGMFVVTIEITRDADEARPRPIDRIRVLLAELLNTSHWKSLR
jgi:hypothetical protein